MGFGTRRTSFSFPVSFHSSQSFQIEFPPHNLSPVCEKSKNGERDEQQRGEERRKKTENVGEVKVGHPRSKKKLHSCGEKFSHSKLTSAPF